jgi:WD40 repeat protein/mono/diheme cytochrome c family protein
LPFDPPLLRLLMFREAGLGDLRLQLVPHNRISVQWRAIALAVGALTFGSNAAVRNTTSTNAERAMRVLHANCLSCHNSEKHKGGLELTSRVAALKGGENGAVMVPGQPDKSLLVQALSPDADPHMPPKKQLSTNQIELLRRWIAAGAPWDEAALAKAAAPREVALENLPTTFSPVFALAISPDAKQLAVGRGNALMIYDTSATNFTMLHETNAHRDAVRSLAWSADGRFIASGSFRELTLWDAETLVPVWSLSSNLLDRITALRFTPDGEKFIAADGLAAQSGWLRVFRTKDASLESVWQAHGDTIFDLSISSDAKRIATASNDKLMKVWDLASRKELTQLEHAGAIYGAAFNSNATEIASVCADKQFKIWDVKTRQSVVSVAAKKHAFTALAWSADGKIAMAGDEDGRLVSFTNFKRHTGAQSSETATEKQLGRWGEPIHVIALSKDAKRIFAGTQDGAVYMVSSEGKLLGKLGPNESVKGSFSLTPALSPKERENGTQPQSQTNALISSKGGKDFSLSGGERAGVRENAVAKTPPAPSFVRDVLPALAKAGCMAGSCHAKADGQNGFKLSVFSYDPKSDYAEIVKEARGRRIFPAAPAESLLLLKPTMTIEHGGGERIEVGSETYRLLVDWIRGGMVYQHTNEPALVSVSVEPHERTYRKRATQPLRVQARYSDGSKRDVTRLADFIANDKEIAQVGEDGVVRVGTFSGESVIVARYMGFVDAARVTVPADRTLPGKRYAALPKNNFIDDLAYEQFRKLGLFPSELCTDAEFLRRSSLDTIGVLPTPEETRAFLADTNSNKRAKWIEHLLAHPAYGDFWANKWADLLRPNPDRVGVKSIFVLDQWLREQFRNNTPYDQFVRAILLTEGSNHREGPAVVYRDRRDAPELTTMFSQLFLGTRMECAKCHHHPNEKWSQSDFYQFAAFFGPVKQKGTGLSPPISGGMETFYFVPGGAVKHPVTDETMNPRPPDGPFVNVSTNSDPRRALADWITNPKNPFFAKAAVNRIWASFFGRGFVQPVDDFRASNPAANEPLLNALALDFAKHGYDLKYLMRTILLSRLYQLSSAPNEFNVADTKNFSRSYRRRLPAEVLLDAVSDITGVPDDFSGCTPGTRAVQTWSYKVRSQFLDAFGRPNSSSDCPCDRDARTSVVQSLHMMNSRGLQSKLSSKEGRVNKFADSKMTPEEIATELFLLTFSRVPSADELNSATGAYAHPDATRQTATEDVLWALLNSVEFQFNH